MKHHYSEQFETGDLVFTSIGSTLFRKVSDASQCWSNHVGIIVGNNGSDYLVAESRIPLSTITTLTRFIQRSSGKRYAVLRVRGSLTPQQKLSITEQVFPRLGKLYHTGFDYQSPRQFCSKFVFDVYQEGTGLQIGNIETFRHLLKMNPDAKLAFWKIWFLGKIPWTRKTITPASIWTCSNLSLIHYQG